MANGISTGNSGERSYSGMQTEFYHGKKMLTPKCTPESSKVYNV